MISAALIYIELVFELYWSGIGIFLVFTLLLMPIALVRGRTFIARHTIHRTVRFRYRLEYRRPVILFRGYALLIITYSHYPSEGLWSDRFTGFYFAALIALFVFPLLPHFDHRIQIDQLQFGNLRFSFAGRPRSYYGGWGIFLLAAGLLTIVFFGVISMSGGPLQLVEGELERSLMIWLLDAGRWGIVASFAYLACIIAVYRSVFTCLYWRSFRIGEDSAIESILEWRHLCALAGRQLCADRPDLGPHVPLGSGAGLPPCRRAPAASARSPNGDRALHGGGRSHRLGR